MSLACFLDRRLVEPRVNESIKSIRQPYHLDQRSDFFPGQLVRVTAAVPTLMVVAAEKVRRSHSVGFQTARYGEHGP